MKSPHGGVILKKFKIAGLNVTSVRRTLTKEKKKKYIYRFTIRNSTYLHPAENMQDLKDMIKKYKKDFE